jgi:hypothetical protein
VLVGTSLTVFGVLSFEYEEIGTVGHPFAVMTYPTWARAMAAVAAALLVGGFNLARRQRRSDSN